MTEKEMFEGPLFLSPTGVRGRLPKAYLRVREVTKEEIHDEFRKLELRDKLLFRAGALFHSNAFSNCLTDLRDLRISQLPNFGVVPATTNECSLTETSLRRRKSKRRVRPYDQNQGV